MSDKCSAHDDCFKSLNDKMDGLARGQDAQRLDIIRIHERIDKVEERARVADAAIVDRVHKMQVRMGYFMGGAVVWFTLVQIVIAAVLTANVKSILGG